MLAGKIEVAGRELPGSEQAQVRGAQPGELVEQGFGPSVDVASAVAETIVGLEAGIGSPGKDDPRARDPVGFLAVDEMPHDIERAERLGTLGATNPRLTDATKEARERGRGPL